MPGIILEGGTFRPIFSAGVMDALLDEDIMFPYMIGVSAGICDGFSYISKQKERNLKILMNHRNDKRYMGAGNLLKERSLLDWISYMTRSQTNCIHLTGRHSMNTRERSRSV